MPWLLDTPENRKKLGQQTSEDELAGAPKMDTPKLEPWGGTPANELNPVGKFVEGAAGAITKGGLGIKGLFTDLTPENQQTLQQIDQFNNEAGGFGTAGKIGGDIASFMLPAGKVAKGIGYGMKALESAPKLAKVLTPIATNVGSGAIVGGALSPNDREGGAIGGAVGGGLGAGVGYVANKVGGGMVSSAVTPEARALMDQGVDVPLWKATENKFIKGLYERAKALPYAKEIMGAQEGKAFEQIAQNVSAKSTPMQPVKDEAGSIIRWVTNPVKKAGSAGVREISERFDEAYKALYGNKSVPEDLVNEGLLTLGKHIEDAKSIMPDKIPALEGAWNHVNRILSDARGLNMADESFSGRSAISASHIRDALVMLQKRATEAYKKGDGLLGEELGKMADVMSDIRLRGLPPEVAAQAKDINGAYTTFKQLQKANASLGAQSQGFVTPRQMLSAIKSGDKSLDKAAFSRGNMPNQSEMLAAENVMGSTLPDVGPGTAEKVLPWLLASGVAGGGAVGGVGLAALPIAAGALATRTGQKFLTGTLPGQGAIRMNQNIVPGGRNLGTYIGASIGEDELKKAPRRR